MKYYNAKQVKQGVNTGVIALAVVVAIAIIDLMVYYI